MKMFLFILLLVAASALHAQTIQTLKTKYNDAATTLTIAADQTAEMVTYVSNGGTELLVDLGEGVVMRPEPTNFTLNLSNPPQKNFIFKGPAVLTLRTYGNSPVETMGIATFKITSDKDNIAPSNAVVIPADANGPTVDVILEQSADLLTWTVATPGTYTPSTAKRFFRVRIVPH